MDERILFDRVHQALDVEPRPDAYERLRIALSKKQLKRQGWQAPAMTWPKMGLRLAAVVTVLALVIAAAAAFLAAHRVADRTVPADSSRAIAAYKVMVSNDWDKVQSSADPTSTCSDAGQLSACEADVTLKLRSANQQLDDLNRFQTPARFAVADMQLRRHIAQQISRLNSLLAAARAGDAAGMNRALAAVVDGRSWLNAMLGSIVRSQQGSAATYTESVRLQKQGIDQCADCQALAGQNQISCVGDQQSTCSTLVGNTATQVASFEAAVVEVAAPSSLAAKDTRLQLDLAAADSALIAMSDSVSAGDQAGFDASRTSLRRALAAVDQDAASILNG